MEGIKPKSFRDYYQRIDNPKGISMQAEPTQLGRQILPVIYSIHEEEGTRRKEGKEEHEGRDISDWLRGFQKRHPQSCHMTILHNFNDALNPTIYGHTKELGLYDLKRLYLLNGLSYKAEIRAAGISLRGLSTLPPQTF